MKNIKIKTIEINFLLNEKSLMENENSIRFFTKENKKELKKEVEKIVEDAQEKIIEYIFTYLYDDLNHHKFSLADDLNDIGISIKIKEK